MEIDLSSVSQARQQVSSSVGEVKRSYDCNWNDSVHDSFMAFVEAFEAQVKKMEGVMNGLDKVKESLKSVCIDKLSKQISGGK